MGTSGAGDLEVNTGFYTSQPAYQRLRTSYAERRRPVVFWVGAGLSQPALPSWSKLREMLIAGAMETLTTLEEAEAERREYILTRASVNEDLWEAFEAIKSVMGVAEFNASIRSIFESSESLDIPEVYNDIWSLPLVNGVVTLNIDGMVSRSHRRSRPGQDIADFVGRDAQDYAHIIGAQKPFIANLHGIHQAASSWVFTSSDIMRLLNRPGYRSIISFIFAGSTVVFLGVSADDVAAGGILQSLTEEGLDLGQHFWVTSRSDAKTDRWASGAGLQVIRYSVSETGDHYPALNAFVNDLKEYVSLDAMPAVVLPDAAPLEKLPSSQALRLMSANELRQTLAGRARAIIEADGGSTDSISYRNFIDEYSREIHDAWHITDRPPHNLFQNFRVIGKVSSGPFSNVWSVVDERDGAGYALKIIQVDNLIKGPEIESFRRGVESLRFLTDANVPGTAKLKAAYEIPTSVVMDFVDGDNLRDIVSAKKINFWKDGIAIIINVCSHLEFAHNLPQGVLHRDVRPSNVMVPYYYWTDANARDAELDRLSVYLINYDLSWHQSAKGKTISGNLSESGYYPPEQVSDIQGELSRSTLVDSYGVGMTLFYTYARVSPPPGGSASGNWGELLRERFRPDPNIAWRSAPERLRRIVERACAPSRENRIGIATIKARLLGLCSAVDGDLDALTPDVWAEELMSRVVQAEYNVDDEENKFSRQLKVGRTFEVFGNISNNSIGVRFRNLGVEGTDWSDVGLKWPKKLSSAKEVLSSGGWNVLSSTRAAHMDIMLEANISIKNLRSNFEKALKTLEGGLSHVRLD